MDTPRSAKETQDNDLALASSVAERRADIDRKHDWVSERLHALGCEGLLVVDPANVAWLTSGATGSGSIDDEHQPGLFYSSEQRYLLSANSDTQRVFDEELDDLGFQVKEWPWHWGRQWLLDALWEGRILACDRRLHDCRPVGDELARRRRRLTPYEQACMRVLGRYVAHALEATCRTMTPGLTEEEVAGQLSHRLLRRGVRPLALGVAGDGRSARQRRFHFTPDKIQKYALLHATGSKFGLCASATRAVCFGGPARELRQHFDAVCMVTAVLGSLARPNASASELLKGGKRIYRQTGFEHEWRDLPLGQVTSRLPVELELRPATTDLLQPSWCITLQACVGAACSCDTFLIGNTATELVTPMESWAVKKLRIIGEDWQRPYLLVR